MHPWRCALLRCRRRIPEMVQENQHRRGMDNAERSLSRGGLGARKRIPSPCPMRRSPPEEEQGAPCLEIRGGDGGAEEKFRHEFASTLRPGRACLLSAGREGSGRRGCSGVGGGGTIRGDRPRHPGGGTAASRSGTAPETWRSHDGGSPHGRSPGSTASESWRDLAVRDITGIGTGGRSSRTEGPGAHCREPGNVTPYGVCQSMKTLFMRV